MGARSRYFVPLGRVADYAHPAPDRTACKQGRGVFDDIECRIWPSRGAMLEACRMAERGAELGRPVWRPLRRDGGPV